MNETNKLSLEQRIGVSTLFMPGTGISLWEALDASYDAGFGAIEIVPADFHGICGYPRTIMSVGFNLDNISDKEIDRLAESVSRFKCRHVHALCRGVNIASRNPGIAAESVRQYMQCAELAVKIDAHLFTYHSGIPEYQEEIDYDDFIIEKNIEFGKKIADFAEKHDIMTGYENLGSFPSPEQMLEMLDGIGSERFGFQFDLGHSFMVPPHDPFVWLKLLGERMVGFHLHSTYHRPDRGYENHQSLDMEGCIDLAVIKEKLTDHGFSGQITLEIMSNSFTDYMEKCKRSKKIFIEAV
jgi:sugar phosphate isomerase/epimerase